MSKRRVVQLMLVAMIIIAVLLYVGLGLLVYLR
jgi:hypothetical protein